MLNATFSVIFKHCASPLFSFLIVRLRSSSSFPKDVNLTFIKCPKSKPINPFEIERKRGLQKLEKEMEKVVHTSKKFDVSQAFLFKSDGVEQIFSYSHLAVVV